MMRSPVRSRYGVLLSRLKADEAPLEDAPPADVEPVLLVPTAEDHGFPKEVPAEEGIPVVAEARDLTQPEPSPATYFCGPLMCDQTDYRGLDHTSA